MAQRRIGTLATLAGIELTPARSPLPEEKAPDTALALDTGDRRVKKRTADTLRGSKLLKMVFTRLPGTIKDFVLAFNRHPARWPDPIETAIAVLTPDGAEPILPARAIALIRKAADARSLLIVMVNLYSAAGTVEIFDKLGIDLDESVLETYIHSINPSDKEVRGMRTRARTEEMARTAEIIMRTAEDDKVRIRAIETLAKIEGVTATGNSAANRQSGGNTNVMIINLLEGIDDDETRARLSRVKETSRFLLEGGQDDQNGGKADVIDVEATLMPGEEDESLYEDFEEDSLGS